MDAGIEGLRVLLAEDEALIAMDLAAALRRAGYRVVGPVGRLDRAMGAIAEGGLDAAVLDINIGGEMVFPAADALALRGVPFVFLTGYDRAVLPERLRDRPVSGKPCSSRSLLALLAEAVARQRRPRPYPAAVRRASGARSS